MTSSLSSKCLLTSATLGSPWAAKRVRSVSRGWQTTVAEQAAKPPHTKWTPAVWLSYGVVSWTTSVSNSKLANCKVHIHNSVNFTNTGEIALRGLLVYVRMQFMVLEALPGRPQSRWREAVQGCGLSRKQRAPPLNECSGRPEITPNTSPPASVKTEVQSEAVGGKKADNIDSIFNLMQQNVPSECQPYQQQMINML